MVPVARPRLPLFAKSKMATFERTHRRQSGPQRSEEPVLLLLDDEAVVDGIFRDFGMDLATSRIICGHVPVKVKATGSREGERTGACIDGASAAYQKTTGLAGFTLVLNAEGCSSTPTSRSLPCAAAVEGTADIRAERRVPAAYDMPARWPIPTRARIRERIALLRTLLYCQAPAPIGPLRQLEPALRRAIPETPRRDRFAQ